MASFLAGYVALLLMRPNPRPVVIAAACFTVAASITLWVTFVSLTS